MTQMMKIMDMNRRISESMASFPDFILCCFFYAIGVFPAVFIGYLDLRLT